MLPTWIRHTQEAAIESNLAEVEHAYETLKRQRPWSSLSAFIPHHWILPDATYAPWFGDSEFMQTYLAIKDHTLVDIYRCYELWDLARQFGDVAGDFLEVGVWRGGTGAIMAKAMQQFPGKKIYLADTFTGVVKAGSKDGHYKGGEHADTSPETVKSLLQALNINNAEILQGIFPDETASAVSGPIAFLHCDVDVYQSAKEVVDWCLPRLSPRGIIVFDDYGFHDCEGILRLCQELRSMKGFRFIHNLNGHGIFIKTG